MIITSPPYWGLRDYQTKGQLGLEATPKQYIEKLRKGFRECWRVLRDDGTLWVNIGDKSYNYRPGKALDDRRHDFKTHPRDIPKVHASRKNRIKGVKEKDIFGLPWRLAFALQDDGWILRQDNIWSKPNPLPESAKDRPARSHEYVFLLTKKKRYYYDWFSVQEPSTGTSKPRTKYKPEAGQHPEIFPELPETFKPGTHKVPGVTPKASTPEANGNEVRHRANAEYSAHLAGESGALRNWRSVWTVHVHPYNEAHYATFPPELIRKPILAGTSEKGACVKCGTPWSRIVSRGEPDRDLQRASGGSLTGGYRGQGRKDYKPARAQNPSEVKRRILEGMKLKRTVGWRQNCLCETSETRPCIVLDPFFGSGTTGKVAMEYGRWCIGIELSPESVKLAEARINTTQGFNFA